MSDTEPKRYSKEELKRMSRLDLVEIVRHWSIHTGQPMATILPTGSKKDFVLSIVVGFQSKGVTK